MDWFKNKNKFMGSFVFGFFILTGTYNAVVINSESHLSGTDVRFVKRLDEINGITIPGRVVAASVTWQKLNPSQIAQIKERQVIQNVSQLSSAPSRQEDSVTQPSAAVQEELSLSLVEVINPKKWQNGLQNSQFNGTLATNNGVIESLSVSLPNGEGLDVSFSEMSGNVFEYDVSGEVYSGMMYQVDQNAYMVTLTNGPLEGTRLRFSAQQSAEEQQQIQDSLTQNNVEIGEFGNNSEQLSQENTTPGYVQAEEVQQQPSVDPLVQADQQMQQEAIQAQSMNMDQQSL